MKNDEASFPAIYTLKFMCALVPGLSLGVMPFIPFSFGVLFITIYSLPVNFYKTMKIALFTVVLKWDLKLAALSMLPFAHLLFPLVTLVTAIIGSSIYFISATIKSIYKSRSPFEPWHEVKTGLENYYKTHQDFVGKEYCDRYDHPTGIPSGWDGQSYGIPFQKILKWQWDFLVCCFLLLVGILTCFTGSILIFVVKLIPNLTSSWLQFCEYIFGKSIAQMLSCWTFYVLTFVLMPVGVVVISVGSITAGTFLSFGIPRAYLRYGYKAGLNAPFKILHDVDGWDLFSFWPKFRVFTCLRDNYDIASFQTTCNQNTCQDQGKFSDVYWDRFVNQCIRSTSILLTRKWISLDDVHCMESSVIQAIPAVAILDILTDTIRDSQTKEEDILWTIDGTLCKGRNRPQLENVAAFLLPKVMQAKRLLSRATKKKHTLYETENTKILVAMLCNNTDSITDSLREFATAKKIGDTSQHNYAENVKIRAKLIELSLAILQIKPFQDRMASIFDYNHIETGIDEIPEEEAGVGEIPVEETGMDKLKVESEDECE